MSWSVEWPRRYLPSRLGQVNFQAPQLTGSSTTVQVVTGCGAANEARSAAITVAVQPPSPEFFYFVQNANGRNPIAAVNATTGSARRAAGPHFGSDFGAG